MERREETREGKATSIWKANTVSSFIATGGIILQEQRSAFHQTCQVPFFTLLFQSCRKRIYFILKEPMCSFVNPLTISVYFCFWLYPLCIFLSLMLVGSLRQDRKDGWEGYTPTSGEKSSSKGRMGRSSGKEYQRPWDVQMIFYFLNRPEKNLSKILINVEYLNSDYSMKFSMKNSISYLPY